MSGEEIDPLSPPAEDSSSEDDMPIFMRVGDEMMVIQMFDEGPLVEDDGELSRDDSVEIQYDRTVSSGGDELDTCAVCLTEFATDEDVGTLACEHRFHVKCIDEWGKYKTQCPTCRGSIPSQTKRPAPGGESDEGDGSPPAQRRRIIIGSFWHWVPVSPDRGT